MHQGRHNGKIMMIANRFFGRFLPPQGVAKASIGLALLAGIGASSAHAAPVGVDGVRGAEWTGITPFSIPYDPAGVGVQYDIYSRADLQYFYALIQANPAGPGNDHWEETVAAQLGNVVNLGLDLNRPVGNGSDVIVETENNRYATFDTIGNVTYSAYSATNGFVQAVTPPRGYSDVAGVQGSIVELAIPWSFFENDPDATGNMPVLTADNPNLVFRYSQSFDGTFSIQGPQFGADRFGVYADPNFSAVPEPASTGLISLCAVGLLKRRRQNR